MPAPPPPPGRQPEAFAIHAQPATDGVVILVARGELDLATTGDLETALVAAEAETPERQVVLDLRGLRFIDSTGIATLVAAHRRQLDAGGVGLRLLVGDGVVGRVFDLVGLDGYLDIDRTDGAS